MMDEVINEEKTKFGLFRMLIALGLLTYIGSAISCVIFGYPMLYLWASFIAIFVVVIIWVYYTR